jgi:hypothetical protein
VATSLGVEVRGGSVTAEGELAHPNCVSRLPPPDNERPLHRITL